MSAGEIVISWDPLAAAWRLQGDPAGPAGTAAIELDGVTWRLDWLDPTVVVEALVFVEGDAPEAPIPAPAAAIVERLLGDDVARALVTLPAQGFERRAPAPSAASRPNRFLAGRLAMALELIDVSERPVWWDVEAVAARLSLGIDLPEGALDRAFEVVDPVPLELLEVLVDRGLADPIVRVLSRAGLADHELPAPLRLSVERADSTFEQLVSGLDLPAVQLGEELLAPTFRRSGAAQAERAVDLVDGAPGVLRRATWRMEGDHPVVTLGAAGTLPSWLGVRAVDLRGRVPAVLDAQRLQVTGTRDGVTISVARLAAVPEGVEVRVELVDLRDATVLPADQRAGRHALEVARAAAAMERHADAEARLGTERAREAMRLAAREWSASAAAWEVTGSGDRAATCRRHAERLEELSGGAAAASEAGTSAGWTESVIASAHEHLTRSSAVGSAETTDERAVAGLASLAEVSGELELAARFRTEQARALRGAPAGPALARLALRHHARLGVQPPRDLGSLGAPAG